MAQPVHTWSHGTWHVLLSSGLEQELETQVFLADESAEPLDVKHLAAGEASPIAIAEVHLTYLLVIIEQSDTGADLSSIAGPGTTHARG